MESKVAVSLFALFALLIIEAAQGGLQPGRCPQRGFMNPFDLTKYAGHWYEISMNGAFFEFGGKCMQAVYTPQNDGTVEVVNTLVDKETNETKTVKGTAIPVDNSGAGKLQVTIPEEGWGNRTETYVILDTDYENYAVVYVCRDLFIARYDMGWILSRKPTLDDKFKDKIKGLLNANKFNPDEFAPTEQDCGTMELPNTLL